ncbi:MAG: hypothetical protein NZM25_07355 [Leptospiraceae bacterium]|nr:hypothetical protein [Leptospiraceae bacterium]
MAEDHVDCRVRGRAGGVDVEGINRRCAARYTRRQCRRPGMVGADTVMVCRAIGQPGVNIGAA